MYRVLQLSITYLHLKLRLGIASATVSEEIQADSNDLRDAAVEAMLWRQTTWTVSLGRLRRKGRAVLTNTLSTLIMCLMNTMEYLVPVRAGKDLDF